MTNTGTSRAAATAALPTALDEIAQRTFVEQRIGDEDVEDLIWSGALDLLRPLVAGAGRVLAMGWGSGTTTEGLLEGDGSQDRVVEVVEGSAVLCEHIRARNLLGLVVHEALFEDFAPVESYDVVLALHVLEHVQDAPALLHRMRTWLRPEGRLVVLVPNAASLHRRLGLALGQIRSLDALSDRDHLVGHRRVYDLAGLLADVEAGGFRIDRHLGYYVKPLANSQLAALPDDLLRAWATLSEQVPPELCANIGLVATPS